MREDVEKAVFDSLYELAGPEYDGLSLRLISRKIMDEVDKHVVEESEAMYDNGYDAATDKYGDTSWEVEDAFSNGYEEGYEEGYAAAKAELSGPSDDN